MQCRIRQVYARNAAHGVRKRKEECRMYGIQVATALVPQLPTALGGKVEELGGTVEGNARK